VAIIVVATASTPDPDLSDNSASAKAEIDPFTPLPGTDLAARLSVIPDRVSVGDPIRINLVVVNLGLGVARNVRATFSVDGPVQASEGEGEVEPGDLGSGGRYESELIGAVNGTGTLTAAASVTTDSTDPNPANNTVTLTTTVLG
jgi:hypothetical protein